MIAYTERIAFDVLAAPLAAVDRRALSQAWYSALHLERDTPAPRGRTHASAMCHETQQRANGAPAQARHELPSGIAVTRRSEQANPALASERRAPRVELARKIERALTRRAPAVHTETYGLRGEHGRVQLIVRTAGDRVHVVAVCAPGAREEVARALDQARYALARAGAVSFETDLREEQA